ncbi:MAG: hypothetical protein Hyperionvirus14_45 [Hyperionvirus sp.]|uniref:Uncharacterized protein n=1 Tax=Hyperionvirus sp. TaxID=2487770 RepID=A0A3G5A9K3_9VIRU|nr:MAG: hypothetical protein Hyperionvirus14_45 [Hyperionvirus sp.]
MRPSAAMVTIAPAPAYFPAISSFSGFMILAATASAERAILSAWNELGSFFPPKYSIDSLKE